MDFDVFVIGTVQAGVPLASRMAIGRARRTEAGELIHAFAALMQWSAT